MRTSELRSYTVSVGMTVREVAAHMEESKVPIALVLDDRGVLVGTVTDGDLRRVHLSDASPDSGIAEIMSRKPVQVTEGTNESVMEELLRRHRIQEVPVVDKDGRPTGIFSLRGQASRAPRCFRAAVVMAGGEGRRLRPLTDTLPKPLVPVQGRPILEHIVGALAAAGIETVFVSVNYRGEMIRAHFGDGSDFGVRIRYLEEDHQLGTAGSLALLPEVATDPLLVLNGDILTDIDYGALWAFHVKYRGVVTAGSVEYVAEIPYGELELAGHFLQGIREKPEVRFQCAAGIYVLEPEVLDLVEPGTYLDMPDLIREVIRAGLPVSVFPIRESWLDIGVPTDVD